MQYNENVNMHHPQKSKWTLIYSHARYIFFLRGSGANCYSTLKSYPKKPLGKGYLLQILFDGDVIS